MAVNKDNFLNRMQVKWTGRGISVSPALKESWSVLCGTLNDHAAKAFQSKWSVIPLPTGTGKTEGLVSYCAELAVSSPRTGVLIVTRFTKEADRIAASVNEEAKRDIAVAKHSAQAKETKPKSSAVFNAQVLVITHSAYKNALALEAMGKSNALHEKCSIWQHGDRLVVVDEVLRIDEALIVDYDELRLARYSIPRYIEQQYLNEINHLDHLIGRFSDLISEGRGSLYFNRMDYGVEETDNSSNFESFLSTLGKSGDVEIKDTFARTAMKVSRAYRKEVLSGLIDIVSLQGHFRRVGDKFQLSAVRMLMPSEIPDAVILDATAKQNKIYGLLGDFVEIVNVPSKVRNYTNVKLHVLYGVSVGKTGLAQYSEADLIRLYSEHCSNAKDANTLFCTHKSNRDKFKIIVPENEAERLVHWGDIDGKNNWSSMSNMIICGLPYLGQVNADNICICLEQWMQNSGFKYNTDNLTTWKEYDEYTGREFEQCSMEEMPEGYWREYDKSNMAVSVIQAINRVRCRQMIDVDGNCADTNIYLFLDKKNGNQQDYQKHLLAAIAEAMPDIQISEKVLEGVEINGLTDHERSYLEMLTALDSGEHAANDVMESALATGLSKRTVRRFIDALTSDSESELKRQVAALGIRYVPIRGPKGSKYIRV